MSEAQSPDLVILGARVYTGNPEQPWAEAFAVTGGKISAVGDSSAIEALAGPATTIERLNDRFVMPGLSDVHAHLGLGGTMLAWDLLISPAASVQDIYEAVRQHAATLEPGEWIVGGVVGSQVMDETSLDMNALAALDEASGGHPVLLREATMHNRWVNSAALEAMGVTADTPDLEDSQYVRDADGRLTGWLSELETSAHAEGAFLASVPDLAARHRRSIEVAVATLNSVGVTSVQDAGSMEYLFRALAELEEADSLSLRVVTSTPVAPFVEPGVTGAELAAIAQAHRSTHVRPDFVKFFLDGVPTTRTTAMLEPYICHGHHEDPEYRGELYWTLEDLVAALQVVAEQGLGAKIHATGDRSVRVALDAIEQVRNQFGAGPRFQIAHANIVSDEDLPRFAELGVVPDASPHLWFPTELQVVIEAQIPAKRLEAANPHRTLLESGAVLSAGSDWPVGAASPSPWLGLETIITRRNPDPKIPGELRQEEALDLAQAIQVFTANPAAAMGLGEVTGRLKVGLSADFIVLDRNLFEIPVDEIHKTVVLSTWFEGGRVYEAETAAAAH